MKIDWIKKSREGIQIKNGLFYIDPIYPVKNAVITHAHADHARPGHNQIFATKETIEIMKERYGANFCEKFTAYDYNQNFKIQDIKELHLQVTIKDNMIQLACHLSQ